MRLGELRRQLREEYLTLPDDTIIQATVPDESGAEVDMAVFPSLVSHEHEGVTTIYVQMMVKE